jgi:hypothetical protein
MARQAVAKQLAAVDGAGLLEPARTSGREVRYQLRPGALGQATAWISAADSAWERRLARLKDVAEIRGTEPGWVANRTGARPAWGAFTRDAATRCTQVEIAVRIPQIPTSPPIDF